MTDTSTHSSNATAEMIFEGTSKGAVCECRYLLPKGWNHPTKPSFIIYARLLLFPADTPEAVSCPTLQFKHYKTLAAGHTFEDVKGLLWRVQRSSLSKLDSSPTRSPSSVSGTSAFITSTQKKIWAICRYTFNNFPITIQKEV
jgi:hypothetical protein